MMETLPYYRVTEVWKWVSSIRSAAFSAATSHKARGAGDPLSMVNSLIEQQGGLGSLLEKFKSGGMADAVKSWIGLGPNQEISGLQLEKVLGGDGIAKLAQSLGVDPQQAKSQIAEMLPKVIDKLTPTGQVPADSFVGQALDALKKNLGDQAGARPS